MAGRHTSRPEGPSAINRRSSHNSQGRHRGAVAEPSRNWAWPTEVAWYEWFGRFSSGSEQIGTEVPIGTPSMVRAASGVAKSHRTAEGYAGETTSTGDARKRSKPAGFKAFLHRRVRCTHPPLPADKRSFLSWA